MEDDGHKQDDEPFKLPPGVSLKRRASWVHKIPQRCEDQLNQVRKLTDVDDTLFNLLANSDRLVSITKFWSAIRCTGLKPTDPRLRECRMKFNVAQQEAGVPSDTDEIDCLVDREKFTECISSNIFLIGKAFKNDFVIPDFFDFTRRIESIFLKCKENNMGEPANYIPQLARVDRNKWGVALCTIDGQRCGFGDTNTPFCLQSCAKPLNYALAISDLGANAVHQWVGQEPSGRSFNELTLDHNNKPHNPMINAGSIVIASLLKPKLHMAARFEYAHNQYKRLAGGEYVGFQNSTYLSERETADRNFALGYYMRENQCFPEGTDLNQTLEFYFQMCSVEVTAESGAVIAATLANGGICPITGERILAGDAVRSTLSLMYSCGMFAYSGQFAFKVGLPAKSGASGAILLIVPNVMGICCWSPLLDSYGNTIKGVMFCEELVKNFNFHNYDDLNHSERKLDPRKRKVDTEVNAVINLLFGAANGDVTAIRRFMLSGMKMTIADYDGRTALHLGAAEGQMAVVKMLLNLCGVPPEPRDRWGHTPLEDAIKFGHHDIAAVLREAIEKKRKTEDKSRKVSVRPSPVLSDVLEGSDTKPYSKKEINGDILTEAKLDSDPVQQEIKTTQNSLSDVKIENKQIDEIKHEAKTKMTEKGEKREKKKTASYPTSLKPPDVIKKP